MKLKVGMTFKGSDDDIIQTIVDFVDKKAIIHYFDMIDADSGLINIYDQNKILSDYEFNKDKAFWLEMNDYLSLTIEALKTGLESGYFYLYKPA